MRYDLSNQPRTTFGEGRGKREEPTAVVAPVPGVVDPRRHPPGDRWWCHLVYESTTLPRDARQEPRHGHHPDRGPGWIQHVPPLDHGWSRHLVADRRQGQD